MEYKIIAVSDKIDQWSNNYGTFNKYSLKLEGVNQPIEWSRKPESPAPVAGETITGTINGKKFTKGEAGFPQAQQTALPLKSENHDSQDSIIRSVALKAAVDTDTSGDPENVLGIAKEYIPFLKGEAERVEKSVVEPDPEFQGDEEVDIGSLEF